MSYVVVAPFFDAEQNGKFYEVGKMYDDKGVPPERLKILSTKANPYEMPFIKKIPQPENRPKKTVKG